MKNKLLLSFALLTLFSTLARSSDLLLTQVIFEEVEPGLAPYITRLLMDKRYLRLDEGNDEGSFVLFDRVKGEIHNFNVADQTEIIIQRGPARRIDVAIALSITEKPLLNAPDIAGMVALEHRYMAQDQLCKTSVNFKGLLPQVVQALVQYEQVLMQQNRKTFDAIPEALKTPCYLANNYLYSSAYLESGFPVHVVDNEGHAKKLLDFSMVTKAASVFERPSGYRVYFPSL